MTNLKKWKQVKNGNIFIIFAFIIMAILFFSSSQTYQEQNAVPLLEKILKNKPFEEFFSKFVLNYAGSEVSIAKLNYFKFVEFFIRKGAHFFTYFLLGGSFYFGLKPKMKEIWLVSIVSWLSATGYAGLDEFHQMLTGGRTPLMQDVFLDSMGALTAILFCLFFYLINKYLHRK